MTQYHQKAVDWREQLRRNKHRTRWVITLFILLYLSVGLLVDIIIYQQSTGGSVSLVLQAFLYLRVVPYATIIMGIIAILSLLITYSMYDKIMLLGTQYREITPQSAHNIQEKQLYNVVEEMKMAAGLRYMPRVYLISADYMNAFASGYSDKSAMVAITQGLLYKCDRAELQAVMAHELSHIRHQDIKLTLTVSVLSNIMLVVIDLLFYSFFYGSRRRQNNPLMLAIMILRMVLPIITILLALYLSRTREYMADAGCVELMRDNEPLARALMKIHQDHQENHDIYRQQYGQSPHEEVRRAAYLYDPVKAGIEPVKDLSSLYSTHPSLTDRLRAIGFTKRAS